MDRLIEGVRHTKGKGKDIRRGTEETEGGREGTCIQRDGGGEGGGERSRQADGQKKKKKTKKRIIIIIKRTERRRRNKRKMCRSGQKPRRVPTERNLSVSRKTKQEQQQKATAPQ